MNDLSISDENRSEEFVVIKKIIFLFHSQIYPVGTRFFEHPKHLLKLEEKKEVITKHSKTFLTRTVYVMPLLKE